MTDHQRPLNKRGRRDAPELGKRIAEHGLTPELIISSSAERARTTAQLVAEHCEYDGAVEIPGHSYVQIAADYLAVLEALPDERQRVMVVGHNPGLEYLLALMSGQHESLPTCALAEVLLPIESWSQLAGEVVGKLETLWRPKEL